MSGNVTTAKPAQSPDLAGVAGKAGARTFAVAPMIDWTDRHCRFFHRQLTRHALLYTEMIVADAVLHGDRERLLAFDRDESPVALQLGGSDPAKLAAACRIAAEYGYAEFNLNVGCPSDRVQSGTFGACLMREPKVVGACLQAMVEATPVPVTVKCRLGVDDQDPEEALDRLADEAVAAGVAGIWVHARKAWLQGLSPKENRTIPPLDYDRVRRLKLRLPEVFVGLNGGLGSLEQARREFGDVDGVMLGRAAYQNPSLLMEVDQTFFGAGSSAADEAAVIETMARYADRLVAAGGRVSAVTRPMIGFMNGRTGARRWRQMLSEGASRPGEGGDLICRAFAAVAPRLADAAA